MRSMRRLWIGGRFVEGTGRQPIEVVNPATEEVVDRAPRGGAALRLANDSPYGLGATLFSNDPLVDNPAGRFGGMKVSGQGRELGEEGLEEFMQTKHVHWDMEAGPKPWWFPLSG